MGKTLQSLLMAGWLGLSTLAAGKPAQAMQNKEPVLQEVPDNVVYENDLELPRKIEEVVHKAFKEKVDKSPVDIVKEKYAAAGENLRFSVGEAYSKDTPNQRHKVVVAYIDKNGNGIFDHENGNEKAFSSPNNTVLNIKNSPFMKDMYNRWVKGYEEWLSFRNLTKGSVDQDTWSKYEFQDKDDYSDAEEFELKLHVLQTAADGLQAHEGLVPLRVKQEFLKYFGSIENPQPPTWFEDTFDLEVYSAMGGWYVCLFKDENGNGEKDSFEKFVNVIQGNQISPFIKIDAPNCPTIRGRGPSCPTDDAVAMYTPASEGEGEIEVVQPVQKQSKGDYAITLEGDLAAKLGGHGEIPEPNQGDFNFGARMFTERAYAEASAGLSVNSRNPRSEASGDHAEFVPADMITTRFALRGSVGYRLTDALFLHATGGVVNVGVRDSGNETQDYKISSDQISAIAGGGAVVSLFGDSLALRLDYTFETGKGETAEIEFPNGNSETFDLERVRGHNLLLQATEKISDRLVVDAYAKTEGNTRLFFLEGSSGAYGRIAVGGNVAYVVGTGSSDFLKVGVGVRQQQTDFIPLYKNEKPDTFVGLFVSAGPISDRSKAYVLQTRQ